MQGSEQAWPDLHSPLGRDGRRAPTPIGTNGSRAHRCGQAGVRACGQADVRTGGQADVQTGGHADRRICGRAVMRRTACVMRDAWSRRATHALPVVEGPPKLHAVSAPSRILRGRESSKLLRMPRTQYITAINCRRILFAWVGTTMAPKELQVLQHDTQVPRAKPCAIQEVFNYIYTAGSGI